MPYAVSSETQLFEVSTLELNEIVLEDDITLSKKVSIGNVEIINLGGHTLSILDEGSLEFSSDKHSIINGVIEASASDPVEVLNYGTEVTLGPNLQMNLTKCAVHVKRRGKVIVSDVDSSSVGPYASFFVEGFGTAKDNSTLVIESGDLLADSYAVLSASRGGKIIVNGGYIETNTDGSAEPNCSSSIHVSGPRTILEVNGGDIYSERLSAISANEGATVIINGGNVQSASDDHAVISLYNDGTSLEVNEGYITGFATNCVSCDDFEKNFGITVTINGGVIKIPNSKDIVTWKYKNIRPRIIIKGGTLHGKFSTSYIPSGYTMEELEGGYIAIYETPSDDDTDDEDGEGGSSEEGDSDGGSAEVPDLSGQTIQFRRSLPVYGSTDTRFRIYDLVGAATIIGSPYITTNGSFYKILFVLPGVGGKSLGFILASDTTTGDIK